MDLNYYQFASEDMADNIDVDVEKGPMDGRTPFVNKHRRGRGPNKKERGDIEKRMKAMENNVLISLRLILVFVTLLAITIALALKGNSFYNRFYYKRAMDMYYNYDLWKPTFETYVPNHIYNLFGY